MLFAAGLATSLTPCVYPMIPITASILGGAGAAGISRRRTAVLTGAYVGGLALVYALLGLLAGLTGSLFGTVASSPGPTSSPATCCWCSRWPVGRLYCRRPQKLAGWAGRLGASSPEAAFVMGAASGLVAARAGARRSPPC